MCSHAINPVVTAPNRPRGRPLGSHNKPLQDQPRSPELAQIDTQITQILHENNGGIPLRYIAFDGNFGNILTLEMVQSVWRKNRYPQYSCTLLCAEDTRWGHANNTYVKIPALASFHAGARTRHGSRKYKGGSRKQKNAYCASARSGYRGASIISCVTAYFLLHASDFVRRFPDRGHGMTWKGGATLYPLPTLHTIRARKITTAVTVAPTHNPTPSVIPCRVRAPGAWNLPAVATA